MTPLLRGALLVLLSEALLVSSGLIIRMVSDELTIPVILFMRNLMGLLLLAPMLARSLDLLATDHLQLHLLRALLGLGSMACLYYSWSSLPLGQAALLKQTAPFFIPLLAWWWLGEGVSRRVRLALLVGFAGVALILKPQQGGMHVALLIGLARRRSGSGRQGHGAADASDRAAPADRLLFFPVRHPAGGAAGRSALGYPERQGWLLAAGSGRHLHPCPVAVYPCLCTGAGGSAWALYLHFGGTGSLAGLVVLG